MNILWVTNIPFDYHRIMLGMNTSTGNTSGSWLYAAYNASKGCKDFQMHIATIASVDVIRSEEHDGSFFYLLPAGSRMYYDSSSVKFLNDWRTLKEQVKPDLVLIWGSEAKHAYVAMKAMKGVPTVIFVQGIMKSIVGHSRDAIPTKYLYRTFRDFYDRFYWRSQNNSFKKQIALEKEMYENAEGVIIENDWAYDTIRAINPQIGFFNIQLPINSVFYTNEWSIDKIERYSIFTNAGGLSIKGHHILYKALAIVKKSYPGFKCYVPGIRLYSNESFFTKKGYNQYLKDLIKEGGLEENVIFPGVLNTEKMSEHLCQCNVYVMPSLVENHSSSLIEALITGTPCISSMAGGAPTLIRQKESGILYNSMDPESLAGNIIRIFEDDELACKLSKGALQLRESRNRDFGGEMLKLYKKVISDKIITT